MVLISKLLFLDYCLWISSPLGGQVISLKPMSRENESSMWLSSKCCYISTTNISHLFIFLLGSQSLVENPQEFRSFWKKISICNTNIKKSQWGYIFMHLFLFSFLFVILKPRIWGDCKNFWLQPCTVLKKCL